jgi:hypothetical protein
MVSMTNVCLSKGLANNKLMSATLSRPMRYEIKYLVGPNQVTELESWLSGKPFVRQTFPPRQVNSIYFDSLDFKSAQDNLDGIANRSKFRIRWYGDIERSRKDLTFEIKSKRGRLGSKVSTPLGELTTPLMKMTNREIGNALHTDMSARQLVPPGVALQPIIYIAYERRYHEAAGGIRITFDQGLNFRQITENRHQSSSSVSCYQKSVLEFKFAPEAKEQAARIMRDLRLVPSRSSKYVIGLSLFGRANYI